MDDMQIKPRKILIVEDDQETGKALLRSLRLFYDVTLVTTANEGWEKIQNECYEVVITDYDLGANKLNGVQFTNLLKFRNRNTPVIMYTGTAENDIYFGERFRPDILVNKPKITNLHVAILDILVNRDKRDI